MKYYRKYISSYFSFKDIKQMFFASDIQYESKKDKYSNKKLTNEDISFNDDDRFKMENITKVKILLKEYLNFIIESEFLIELLKISLSNNDDFSPYEEFTNLRSDFYQAVVNEESLKKIFSNDKECYNYCYLLISRFSRKGFEAFDFKDFEYELKTIETIF